MRILTGTRPPPTTTNVASIRRGKKLPLSLPYACIFHNLGLWENAKTNCASLTVLVMEEDLYEVVLENLCCHCQSISIFGPTKFSLNFSNNSGNPCNRSLDAFVVSCSSGVNFLVCSADSSAELVRCASLERPNKYNLSILEDGVWTRSTRMITHFLRRVSRVKAPLVCLR